MSSILLALAIAAAADEPAPKAIPVLPALPVQQNDPEANIARIARGILGPKGGNRLFYFPTRDEPATPATWGFNYENVHFNSADGTPLHGWFIPARGARAAGTIIFSHGNTGSVGHHLGFVMWLVEAGYHVLIYDYRGFGKSGGIVSRRGMVDDVKAAFSYTRRRADVDPRRLVSYGHSMGGAKSVAALGEAAPVDGLRAVVVDASFASYQTMARIMGGRIAASLVTDELAPEKLIRKLSPIPLLIVHGTLDEIVPVSQGRLLYKAAGQPKTLFEVKAGRHGNALYRDHGAYRKRMLKWLSNAVPEA
ncbi:MAG: alpha/beta hydrolase [Verrucomicrobiales bacterium]|nr:alpha/beta fold hydrolase [Verrucomicrobiota bacterium JB025]